MDQPYLFALAGTGFSVAFLHAAIPTHWLPFVAIGRARGWSTRRTLAAVMFAGGGHVLATTALGVAIAWFGFEMDHAFEHAFHWIVAALLVGLGAWLAFRKPHGHDCEHCQGHPGKFSSGGTDRSVMWGLFLMLTLSPCELFLPVYLTAVPYGWSGVAWLSGVLAVATLLGMTGLTWMTLRGIDRLRWRWLARPDPRIVGGLLCLLGVFVATAH
jgi:hypothetical protein